MYKDTKNSLRFTKMGFLWCHCFTLLPSEVTVAFVYVRVSVYVLIYVCLYVCECACVCVCVLRSNYEQFHRFSQNLVWILYHSNMCQLLNFQLSVVTCYTGMTARLTLRLWNRKQNAIFVRSLVFKNAKRKQRNHYDCVKRAQRKWVNMRATYTVWDKNKTYHFC
jgi:hypothetical protein